MNKIKKIIGTGILLLVGLLILVLLSLHGERNYLESCKNLDIKCEEGNIQKATEYMNSWIQKTYKELEMKWKQVNSETKQEQMDDNILSNE